jgi:protein gp37
VDPGWVVDLSDQCRRAGTSFFFKQWSGVHKHKTGRVLEGRTQDEMPALAGQASEQQALFNQ